MSTKTLPFVTGDLAVDLDLADDELDDEGRALLARELGIADVFRRVTSRAREIEAQFPRRGAGGITTTRRA